MSGSLMQMLMAQQNANKPPPVMPQPGPAVPLASMVDRLSPDAVALQRQNPSLPWWAAPGMFKSGPQGFNQPGAGAAPPPAAAAPAAAAQPEMTPEQMQQAQLQMMMQALQQSGGGGSSEGG